MMGWIGETVDSIKSIKTRHLLTQAITLGMIVTSALIMWKALMCVTGTESPVVVVLSGSMEPGFQRGDILFLHMTDKPIRVGEIVVFNVDGEDIPIVHRAIKVHERGDTGEVEVLTKGDNNEVDDIGLYAERAVLASSRPYNGQSCWVLALCWMGDYYHDRKAYNQVYTHWCVGFARYNIQRLKDFIKESFSLVWK